MFFTPIMTAINSEINQSKEKQKESAMTLKDNCLGMSLNTYTTMTRSLYSKTSLPSLAFVEHVDLIYMRSKPV